MVYTITLGSQSGSFWTSSSSIWVSCVLLIRVCGERRGVRRKRMEWGGGGDGMGWDGIGG
jgi:hypothetical protein